MSEGEWVTVETAGDVIMARLIASRLEAEGIPTLIPDEHTVGVAWHLANALGGVRVQVPADFADDARALLQDEDPSTTERDADGVASDATARSSEDAADTTATEGSPDAAVDQSFEESEADGVARRAFRVAIISTLLFFVAPYVFSLAIEAFRRRGLSRTGRRRVWLAVLIACLVCGYFFVGLGVILNLGR